MAFKDFKLKNSSKIIVIYYLKTNCPLHTGHGSKGPKYIMSQRKSKI